MLLVASGARCYVVLRSTRTQLLRRWCAVGDAPASINVCPAAWVLRRRLPALLHAGSRVRPAAGRLRADVRVGGCARAQHGAVPSRGHRAVRRVVGGARVHALLRRRRRLLLSGSGGCLAAASCAAQQLFDGLLILRSRLQQRRSWEQLCQLRQSVYNIHTRTRTRTRTHTDARTHAHHHPHLSLTIPLAANCSDCVLPDRGVAEQLPVQRASRCHRLRDLRRRRIHRPFHVRNRCAQSLRATAAPRTIAELLAIAALRAMPARNCCSAAASAPPASPPAAFVVVAGRAAAPLAQ